MEIMFNSIKQYKHTGKKTVYHVSHSLQAQVSAYLLRLFVRRPDPQPCQELPINFKQVSSSFTPS